MYTRAQSDFTEPKRACGMKGRDALGAPTVRNWPHSGGNRSTGYGDVVPVHPLAPSLCNVESIIGQLYPATILARLVTLELRVGSN